MNKKTRGILGWVIYDWANSAFATTIMAGFFPVFFKQYWSFGTDVNVSTAQLGFGNSLASLLVALMAPVLGAIADKGSMRKNFMIFFTYIGVLMTAALFLVQKGDWLLAIFIYAMGIIGFSGANIFYDSLLPVVADKKNIDFVSGIGFAAGYLGGGLLFLVNVLMTLMPEKLGFANAAEAVRFSFITVALWWGGFTIFAILWIPKESQVNRSYQRSNYVIQGFNQFILTFKQIRHLKGILLFLVAYWFYIDGVGTIIRMAVDYGISLGFAFNDLIIALLITQFVGFPSALIFGKLGQRWSVRKSIYITIVLYMIITVWGVFMNSKHEFYMIAIAIGLGQGGIQALSRSYYSRLIPIDQSAKYYGFFNMIGKFAAIMGPFLIGVVGLVSKQFLMPDSPDPEQIINISKLCSRIGISSIMLFFIIGGVLFYFVDEKKAKAQLVYLD